MADAKSTKETKGAKGSPKGGPSQPQGKGKEKAKATGATDPSPKAAEGKPRLQTYYEQTVRGRLQKEFGLSNPHEVPRLQKVVLNVGMGEGAKNPKALEAAAAELATITGQHPVITRAKKAISNFSLRAGVPHPRLPRAPEPELRWAGELYVRHQGADDLPRDRFRQGRENPRDGHHDRDLDDAGRSGDGAVARAGVAVQGRDAGQGGLTAVSGRR
jgi:hypothetical protein